MLEVCVDSADSAFEAWQGGADRLELCSGLIIGGTTPSPALLRAVKEETGLPVHALLRPRFGDFLYTEREFQVMLREGEALLEAGADALVSGCLTPEGELDMGRMEQLVSLAHGRGGKFTLHRAFDVCRDPFRALEQCRALGVDAVLTSGQAASCVEGLPLLKRLLPKAEGIELLFGAGISAEAIRTIRRELPQAKSFHMSGKKVLESSMSYRKEGVSMGLPGISEFQVWRTDREAVRAAEKELSDGI